MNMGRGDAIKRIKRQFDLPKPQPVQLEDDQVPYFVFTSNKATQISEANLDPKDVVCYIKMALLTPTAVKNVKQSGKDLLSHVSKEQDYFIISLQDDIAGVIQSLIKEALNKKK